VNGCVGSGTILGEGFLDIPGTQVTDLTSNVNYPNNPGITAQLPGFEYSGVGDNYGGRLRGYICVPVTGEYTFYIAGDDQAGLFLSTDENPNNKVLIAFNLTPVGFRDWTATPSQKSAPIRLIKGVRYYIETLHKQSTGANHLSVGWIRPDGVGEGPIPAERLSPYIASGFAPGAGRNFRTEMQMANINQLTVTVAPNPTSNHFNITVRAKSAEPLKVTITDVAGRIVERMDRVATNGTFQVGDKFAKGIYFMEVRQGSDRKVVKLVKQ
jgi:hypothetical protein